MGGERRMKLRAQLCCRTLYYPCWQVNKCKSKMSTSDVDLVRDTVSRCVMSVIHLGLQGILKIHILIFVGDIIRLFLPSCCGFKQHSPMIFEFHPLHFQRSVRLIRNGT